MAWNIHMECKTYSLLIVSEQPVKEGVRNNENAGVDLYTVEDWNGTVGEPPHLLDLGTKAMMISNLTGDTVHFYW
jgi:hypothetical protein